MLVTRGFVVTAVCFAFSFAIASAATPLTLQDSVIYALSHNAAIAAKKSALASAQAAFTKARAQELPPVTGTLQNQLARSSNAGGQFAQFGIAPSNKFSQNTAQIGTQWTLYNGSLTQIQAQEGNRQLQSARADLKQTEEQVANTTVSAYFGVASKENGSLIARNNLTYQQALLTVARAKERAGLVAGVDVLRADTAVQQALSTNLIAQSDAQTARETLAQSIGAPIETPFAVTSNVPEPALPSQTVEALSAIAQANRPDIAIAQANLAVAKLSRAAIDTDLRPQISLNGAFGNQLSPTNAAAQAAQVNTINAQCASGLLPPSQCAGAPFTFNRGTPGFWQIGATTTLGIPLIDYGTRKTAHAAGDESIRAAQLALDTTVYGAQADVHQSFRGAQTAAASLVYQKKAAALATESARIAQLQYKNGLISLTDVTAAQNTAVSAQTDLFNARVAYVNALVKLRTALGTFDPAGIVSDL